MNTPTGFRLVNGKPTDINPLLGLINPAMPHEIIHMMIAAYVATGFAVAGIHAAMLLRDPDNPFHRRAIAIAFSIGAIAALGQPISGDFAARAVAKLQPIKLAAFEGLFPTESHAPIAIGGIPDVKGRKLLYAFDLPDLLSIMTYHNPDAVVRGLDSFPEKDWPDPLIAVHLAFQAMVGLGFAMVGMALWAGLLLWRRRTIFNSKLFLLALVATAPFGLIAVEAGWIVTEVGRQPWIIYRVMLTAQAVTPMPGLIGTFSMFTVLYFILAGTVVYMMWRQVLSSPTTEELAAAAAAGR
jgi:cytochrome d ubiquinol oxidase subunit I